MQALAVHNHVMVLKGFLSGCQFERSSLADDTEQRVVGWLWLWRGGDMAMAESILASQGKGMDARLPLVLQHMWSKAAHPVEQVPHGGSLFGLEVR